MITANTCTMRGVRWKSASSLLFFFFLMIFATNGHSSDQIRKIQVCENEVARLECPNDSEQIAVELANFGRFSRIPCNPTNAVYNNNCPNNATFVVLAHKCNGQQNCEFLVDHTVFGDPCPGTPKYLEAKYSCIHVTTTVAPTTEEPVVEPDEGGYVDVDEKTRSATPDGVPGAADGCRRSLISDLMTTNAETLDTTIFRFSTKHSEDPAVRVECARWSATQRNFVVDGMCTMVDHNSTETICRCTGPGEFGVVESTCNLQILVGLNKESIMFYASCALAAFGMLIYITGMAFVEERPKFAFISRRFCVAIIVAEIAVCVWFSLPRKGLWESFAVYVLHAAVFGAVCWVFVQLFQLAFSLLTLVTGRKWGGRFFQCLIGYGVPVVLVVVLLLTSGNVGVLRGQFQTLRPPTTLFVSPMLFVFFGMHAIFALLVVYLLCKRFRVGYMPCQSDYETITYVRSSLSHLAPLIISIDAFCFVVLRFVSSPVALWLWSVVGANVLQIILTLRVLGFENLCSGDFFCQKNKKPLGANNLPKNSVFSPSLQQHNMSANMSYNEHVSGLTKQSGVVGQFYNDHSNLHTYVPRVGGVHDAHYCDHAYATIPSDPDYYHPQRYCVYQQHGNQVQLPNPPPIPAEGLHRDPSYPVGSGPHPMINEYQQRALVCNEHANHCLSLGQLRMSNTQLYNNHPCLSHPRPPSDGSLTGRSSSTGDTTASATSSKTLLLRMDLGQVQPIVYLDESSST